MSNIILTSKESVRKMSLFTYIYNGFRGLYYVTLAKYTDPKCYNLAKKILSELK